MGRRFHNNKELYTEKQIMGVQTGPQLPGALHRKTDRWTDRSTTTRSITHKQMGGQTDPQQQGTLHRHTDGWTDGSTTTRSIKNRQTDHGVCRRIHNNIEDYTDKQMGGETDPQQQRALHRHTDGWTDGSTTTRNNKHRQTNQVWADGSTTTRSIRNGQTDGVQTDPQQQGALHRHTNGWTDRPTTTRSITQTHR